MTREEAIKQLESLLSHCLSMKNDGDPIWDNDCEALKMAILAIDPESLRPRGTWEGTADGYADGELVYDTWTCSECGYTVDTDDTDELTRFCPNCGAKMEVGY